MTPGALVVSLDFELHWGVRDLWTVARYRRNLLGVRDAVPALLALFAELDVHATWATVGFLFCDDRRELLDVLPARRPSYEDPRLSPYAALADVGTDERDDPFHFAPSLVRRIADTPGQEIGSHTLSHFYCLEPGQSPDELRADLEAACRLARAKTGRRLESIVFPRNQVSPPHVAVCGALGFRAYRGNQTHWAYRERRFDAESPLRRAFRLADAYVPLSAPHVRPADGIARPPVDVAASRYLRPWSASRRGLETLRLRRIVGELRHAARTGGVYHLWWHPHDFGTNLRENLAFLRRILMAFAELRDRHGMESLTMAEAARQMSADDPVDAPARPRIVVTTGRDVVTSHFEVSAPYWRDVYAGADVQAAIYRQRLARALGLVDAAGLPAGAPVLEIGCGAGAATVALARRGYAVHAVDPAAAMLALARRHAAEARVAVGTYRADVGHLPFPDGTFDLVLALGVLPWLADVDGALGEMRRVLRPGGHLVVSADNRWRLNALVDPRLFPPLSPLRRRVRDLVDRARRRAPGARVRMDAAADVDRRLAAGGLVKVDAATLGFGPFSLFGRALLSDRRAVRLHETLQRLADGGAPVLRATGAHYVVLARRPPATPDVAPSPPAARAACP